MSSVNRSYSNTESDRLSKPFRFRDLNYKRICWNGISLPIVAVIYWTVNSDGVRAQLPILGMRLYKLPLPFVSHLQDFEATYRLDLAHVFVMVLLFAVWYVLRSLIRIYLFGFDQDCKREIDQDRHQNLMIGIGIILMTGDLFIFYQGLSSNFYGWQEETNFITSLVSTIVYGGVLFFVSYIHVTLED